MAFTFPLVFSNLPVLTAIILIIFPVAESYSSIFSFGDSLADTGNFLYLRANEHPRVGQSPYGQTYFHHPTGRFSDGRLVIDFIAQAIGIPFLPPYFACPGDYDFRRGVNFAVGGATALDPEFFEERGIYVETNCSLGHQIDRFKRILPSICASPSDCRKILSEYLFLVGEIGGNDYNIPSVMGWTIQEMQPLVGPVVNAISSAIKTLIDHGATTLVVPGDLPVGCSTAYLTMAHSHNKEDYDPITGCLKKWNEFTEYSNKRLIKELDRLRYRYPHATIIYADYYNIAMRVFRSPHKFAEAYGLPNLPPYLASLHQHKVDSQQGVNFAVAGATALDPAFFQEGNVTTKVRSNDSLSVQMGWFEQFKSSLCQTTQESTDYLGKSLFLLGEIGSNDYDYSLFQGLSIAQVRTFVPKVVQAISAATSRLIEQGAMDLVVPGIPPIGCFPYHLTIFSSPKKEDYDPRNGCLKALNGFSKYHNSVLQTALEKLRQKYPHANIIYADYYGATMRLFHSPKHFGFTNVHSACCGQGGPYNFNGSALCGAPGSTVCVDPSTFVSWDGIHFTEAASRIISNGMLEGLYTTPPMTLPHQELNHGL